MSSGEMSKNIKIVSWVLRIALAAGFVMMGALPKLSGDPMTKELFEKLGVEPFGRLGIGSIEALIAVLLLAPKTTVYGGILSIGLMLGALFSHFTKLGFPMDPLPNFPSPPPVGIFAVVFLILGVAITYMHRGSLPFGKATPKLAQAT
jgi:uncharacterized membrane protein YphA (DoxX/SURF4 family)